MVSFDCHFKIRTKTPLIVKLLADRAERSLDSKISKRNNSSGGKNTNNY